jgi:uncharacterized membrane protein
MSQQYPGGQPPSDPYYGQPPGGDPYAPPPPPSDPYFGAAPGDPYAQQQADAYAQQQADAYAQQQAWYAQQQAAQAQGATPQQRGGTGAAIVGIFLVGLGVWFLFRDEIAIDFGTVWPVVAVGLGILMVIAAFIPRKGS